jgi:hypothetical protein
MTQTPTKVRLRHLLTVYGFPPVGLRLDEGVVRATFARAHEVVAAENPYPAGATDSAVASDLIILAAARGVKPAR